MPMPDPLSSPIYQSGGLIQQCHACHFAQRGHRSELIDCPHCGEPLGPFIALAFGGLAVQFDGRDFWVFSRGNLSTGVLMQRGDMPEVAQFICRHVVDVRTGQIVADGGMPRRVPWRRDLHDHFFIKE